MRDHEFIAMDSNSTIGRSYDLPLGRNLMQSGHRMLGVVSSRLASRLAARVVLAPPQIRALAERLGWRSDMRSIPTPDAKSRGKAIVG